MWKGPELLLAALQGIVHKLNKVECNKGQFHKILDVCSARVQFNTTPWNHGSIVQKVRESSLNARISQEVCTKFAQNLHKIGTKFTFTTTCQYTCEFAVDANFMQISCEFNMNMV